MEPVRIESYGHGGVGVCRVDGMVHFVAGALPGDVVRFDVTKRSKRWARAEVVEVVEASPHRRAAPCPHAGSCGGCDLQHATEAAQREWKRAVVVEQLTRLGGVDVPPVGRVETPSDRFGYRNRMDFSVLDGRPALHRRSSHDLVPLDVCLLLAPPLRELFDLLGDLDGLTGITMRAGMATGEAILVVDGDPPPHLLDLGVAVGRAIRGRTEPVVGLDHIHEVVAGTRFRITGRAFFQNSTAGAEALVRLVADAVAGRQGTFVDLYAGGGLFALTVGAAFRRVVAVESGSQAASDLAHNAELAAADVEVHRAKVESIDLDLSGPLTVVVDPPRDGLGRQGVETVAGTGADMVVYVSCDPASLGRDVGLLTALGYRLARVSPVDLFPQTHHVEAVAVLER